ncbi:MULTISPECIES: metal ABC transporter permease [Enterococcus]|uniref:Manganese import system permease protein ScaB n=1 Tax=Enterococcus mundtii TaxID=53346 RepID=A0A1V2UIS8_ENTMU|nr:MULTISPECIES: metal ABC transporter permease [Enterococcus]ONN43299.1 manganese ABC transporter permease [Enterococcus mundtii]
MIQSFIEGLMDYRFLQYALTTSMLVGLASGVIGSFIILRGMSLMGDAISHAVLPGVAISYMFGFSYILGATAFGMLTAGIIGFVTQRSRLKNDTAIGIVFSSFFALGVILISFAQSATNLYHILFGNVLAVRESDMLMTAIVSGIVLLFVFIFYKELKITSFDPMMAKAYGLNTTLVHYLLMFFLTLVAVVSLQTVGTILVISMLITPAATAYLLTDRLAKMIFISATVGVLSAIIGVFYSYSYNWPSGATIVLTSAVFFTLAFLFSPTKGIIFLRNKTKKNAKS